MKISTEIGSASKIIGEERAVEAVAKAGFNGWDFSMDTMDENHPLCGTNYLAFARHLKQIGLDNGIVCNQSHAPFPTADKKIRSVLKKRIECTAEAGGEICVIHPQNNETPEKNAEMYSELLPFAKQCGVKIATENMWNWDHENNRACFAACATPESFCKHIDVVNDEYLVACLDIGHAEMMGSKVSAVGMVKALAHRIAALHIHDNDRHNDSHQIPFSMDIDLEAVAKALKEVGYKGWYTLEAGNYFKDCPENEVQKRMNDMAEAVKKFASFAE